MIGLAGAAVAMDSPRGTPVAASLAFIVPRASRRPAPAPRAARTIREHSA